MSKKLKDDNGADPLARAQSALEAAQAAEREAQQALDGFDQSTAVLRGELQQTESSLDDTEDPKERTRLRRLVLELREDLASHVRMRKARVAAVEAAAQARTAAAGQWGLAEIARLEKAKAETLLRAKKLMREAVEAVHEAEVTQAAKDEVARTHGLETPSEQRFLFEHADRPWLTSDAAETLRAALDVRHLYGVDRTPAS